MNSDIKYNLTQAVSYINEVLGMGWQFGECWICVNPEGIDIIFPDHGDSPVYSETWEEVFSYMSDMPIDEGLKMKEAITRTIDKVGAWEEIEG